MLYLVVGYANHLILCLLITGYVLNFRAGSRRLSYSVSENPRQGGGNSEHRFNFTTDAPAEASQTHVERIP